MRQILKLLSTYSVARFESYFLLMQSSLLFLHIFPERSHFLIIFQDDTISSIDMWLMGTEGACWANKSLRVCDPWGIKDWTAPWDTSWMKCSSLILLLSQLQFHSSRGLSWSRKSPTEQNSHFNLTLITGLRVKKQDAGPSYDATGCWQREGEPVQRLASSVELTRQWCFGHDKCYGWLWTVQSHWVLSFWATGKEMQVQEGEVEKSWRNLARVVIFVLEQGIC